MESANIDSAQHYYNTARRRSFFYSRLFVILSMFILLAGLGLNLSFFYSNQKTSVASHASSGDSPAELPALPSGCAYQTQNNRSVVVCPSANPSAQPVEQTATQFPIAIELPQLPSQCHYQTTNKGYKVSCLNSQNPIPTTLVTLPQACSVPTRINNQLVQCKNASGKTVAVPLPKLPEGCEYIKQQNTLSIACSSAVK